MGSGVLDSLVLFFYFLFFFLLLVVLHIKTRQGLSDCLICAWIEQLNHSVNSRHFEALNNAFASEAFLE